MSSPRLAARLVGRHCRPLKRILGASPVVEHCSPWTQTCSIPQVIGMNSARLLQFPQNPPYFTCIILSLLATCFHGRTPAKASLVFAGCGPDKFTCNQQLESVHHSETARWKDSKPCPALPGLCSSSAYSDERKLGHPLYISKKSGTQCTLITYYADTPLSPRACPTFTIQTQICPHAGFGAQGT